MTPWTCPVCGALNTTLVCPVCLSEMPEADDGQTYIKAADIPAEIHKKTEG